MYHIAKKYHPLYLDKMSEMQQQQSDETKIYDKGGRNKFILNNLKNIVEECLQKYGGKKELATEQDDIIVKLCDAWEEAISYGIKIPQSSLFKNVHDMMSRQNTNNEPNFWDFCRRHLTNHEKDRFESLLNVWTPRGKTKALIRAAFNERSLERYVLMWLSDPTLSDTYELWSIMLNQESSKLLPSMAASLSSILFAVSVDTPDINVTKSGNKKNEPIVFTPAPVGPSKKLTAIKREIVSLDGNNVDDDDDNDDIGGNREQINNNRLQNQIETKDIEIVTGTTLSINTTISNNSDNNSKIHEIKNNFESEDSAVDVLEHLEILQNQTDTNFNNKNVHDTDSNHLIENLSENNVSVTPDRLSNESSSYFSRHSSIRSSNDSTISNNKVTDIIQIEQKFKEMTEKCAFLEARVAELSLENRRLHRLMNHSSGNENWQFLVSIPKAILKKSGPKSYYIYEIHVNFTNNTDEWITFKRYSEFYKLHQKYKKNNTFVKALDFPPKKKIGNMDIAFVEERRQRLQIYLRHLLAILPEISNCTTKFQLLTAFPFLRTNDDK